MASIYYLNHPSGSFWDTLAAGLEEHPFFASHGHHSHPHHSPPPFWGWGGPSHPNHHHSNPPPFWGWGQSDDNDGPNARNPHQTREATPGPSDDGTKKTRKETSASSEPETENDMRYRCWKGKRTAHNHGLGGGHGSRGRHGPCHPRNFHHGGARGFPFGGRGAHRGRGRHPRGPASFGGPNFDFLRNLAGQFGVHFEGPTPEGVDFVPSADVFDTPDKYIVHVSLPGAKKDDLSIDYDVDESVLRLAGVVYRLGINEDLHQALVMEERAREVGVFEREVRFGTREAPAVISVDEITAKLEDGVLSVVLPKVVAEPEPEPESKKVFVEDENVAGEKDVNEKSSVTMTPDESEESDAEETKEYVKVPVS